jgi:hypothetical protein
VSPNGTWQRNLDQLRWRLPLFDGRKVVAVATGGRRVRDTVTRRGVLPLDPAGAVREYLGGTGCEVLAVPNDPALREVATWVPLWDRLREFAGTDDVAFYAHAKAVTRPWNPGVTCHPWARMMYSSLLDFWPVVDDLLARHPVVGSFKKIGHGFKDSASAWHYSGSFFWARLRDAFRDDRVGRIDRAWYGNEAWVGLHWRPEEGGCVFKAGHVGELDCYEPRKLFDQYLPEFRAWCGANAGRRTVCGA